MGLNGPAYLPDELVIRLILKAVVDFVQRHHLILLFLSLD